MAVPDGDPDKRSRSTDECQECDGFGWLYGEKGVSRCLCWYRARALRLLEKIPPRFRKATFKSYEPTCAKQEKAKAAMVANPAGSYLLTGQVNEGKTHLLMAQYRELVRARRFDVVLVTDVEFARWARKSVGDETFRPPLSLDDLEKMKTFHLFLDDLGKSKCSQFLRAMLFELVNLCYVKNAGITVTTNLSIEALANWVDGREEEYTGHGDGVVRRLEDICEVVEF